MTRTWKVGILLAAVPTLSWGFQSPHAIPITPDATESESPFDGHYERTGANPANPAKAAEGTTDKAMLDIVQVGPGVLRIKGSAVRAGKSQTGNAKPGDISGTLKPDRLKARFENAAGCKLEILFEADGLKVQNTSAACGGPFDGEYKRTGPSQLGVNPGVG